MAFSIIIPARYHSSRLPKKMLLDLNGKTILERTYIQAKKSQATQVIIATDSPKIVKACEKFDAPVILTNSSHQSGTQRLVEVIELLNLDDNEVVVNVQGDEPLLPPILINQVADLLTHHRVEVATLCEPIQTLEDYHNENCVKVVFNQHNKALYFSRATIPYFRHPQPVDLTQCYRHIGLYAYSCAFLRKFNQLSHYYEQAEALEQLRILGTGYDIQIDIAQDEAGYGIDTQADLDKARQLRY